MDPDALRRRRWLTVVVMMATIMQALDGTIANVALPNIQGSLSATQEQVAWVITSYIVSAAIATPLAGFCAVRFGVRRILVSSVIGFTIASMLCGAAQTLPQLVAFRTMQGVCGAALVPLSQTLMMEAYPREEQGKAMALWGVGTMLGPITGPTLGGWLTDEYTWRWVFYINLPVGILCAVGLMILIKNKASDTPRPFDLLGFTLLSIAIGTFQLMLECADGDRQQRKAQEVERPRRVTRLVLDQDHQPDRAQDADRQVDIEHPAPGVFVGQPAAERRAGDGAQHRADAPQRHRLALLLARIGLHHQRLAERHQRGAADALHGAEGHELRQRLGGAAQHRGDGEADHRAHQDAPHAEAHGAEAGERRGDRRRHD